VDWPVSYDELEPFYSEVETIMSVSGSSGWVLSPRSIDFPQPPHNFNNPDKLLKKALPNLYYSQPTARPRRTTKNRPACCATGTCHLCPINSKFTIQNEMLHLYQDRRVKLLLNADVQTVDSEGGTLKYVNARVNDESITFQGEVICLGANTLFNAAILLRSGFTNPNIGKGLHEQASVTVVVMLNDIDNYQGSSSITGHGYMFYDGVFRRERAGCLVEYSNVPTLRFEKNKW